MSSEKPAPPKSGVHFGAEPEVHEPEPTSSSSEGEEAMDEVTELKSAVKEETKKEIVPILEPDQIMADGPWQWRSPRLRKDFGGLAKHKRGHGTVTREETLWMVMISLGFAKNRNDLVNNHDIELFVLHFFCLWTVLYSCILYASRFNDRDTWHSIVWGTILMCLLFAVGCIDEPGTFGSFGFGWATCALHLTMCIANARVAIFLPRARVYGAWMSLQSAAAASLFAFLPFFVQNSTGYRCLLWINIFIQPTMYTLYKAVLAALDAMYPSAGDDGPGSAGVGYGSSCHVPADFSYLLHRYQSVHMLIIVSAVLGGISLHAGQAFFVSNEAKVVVICAVTFALMIKLSILDIDQVKDHGPDSFRHPLRRGYVTSRVFLLLFPLSVLGIAVSGYGFYISALDAAGLAPTAAGNNVAFVRKLLSFGPATSWTVFTINKSLTEPRVAHIHWRKIAALVVLALAFLMPYALEFDRLVYIAVWVVCVQASVLAAEVFAMWAEEQTWESLDMPGRHPTEYGTWHYKQPRLLKDWDSVEKSIGSQIDKHELFSSILIATSLIGMNNDLADAQNADGLAQMALYYFTIYGSVAMTMRYSSRFSDKDVGNRIMWSVYQFCLLSQVLGISSQNPILFAVGSAAIYLWVGLSFWLRIAIKVRRARPYACYCLVTSLVLAAICSVRCFAQGNIVCLVLLAGIMLVSILCEPVFNLASWCLEDDEDDHPRLDLPINTVYIQNRFNSLYMVTIATTVTKGGLNYPGTTNHPGLVCIGIVCVGLLALSVQAALFHVAPVSLKRHAVQVSQTRGMIFIAVHPFTMFCMALLGGTMSMLLKSVGQDGPQARTPFSKTVCCCAAAVFWLSVAVVHNLHAPRTDPRIRHLRKVKTAFTLAAFAASIVPLVYTGMTDLCMFLYITAVFLTEAFLHLLVNVVSDRIRMIKPETSELKLHYKSGVALV